MTNSWTDLKNARCFLIGGSNTAENHPIAMRYILQAQAAGAKVIVVDPRFTRTASKADIFAQLRPGTDIAYLGAIINYILEQGLYDRDYLVNFTNATFLINPSYTFSDGLFAGYDPQKKAYANGAWAYQLDEAGRPVRAASLDAPGTVFTLLREHYRRYTLDTAAAITGIPAATIKLIADTLANYRPATILYALGMTQHTTATQGIRAYAVLQLLLGNIGKVGGGVNALRGEPNVQGSTDFSNLATTLPGYIPAPAADDTDSQVYGAKYGAASHKHLLSLLKAWFGANATAANDYGYAWLPRLPAGKAVTYLPMLEDMARGQFKVLFNVGINPLVSIPNNQVVMEGLRRLEMLVVVDLFESETAQFWRAPFAKATDIATEVLFLPAAFLYEKAGSFTNSGRWVQWKEQALAPEGQARSDLDILDGIFKKVRSLYQGSSDPKDWPILHAAWDYGAAPEPEKVLQEINGYHDDGRRISSLAEYLAAPAGTVSCGCWIYAGVFGNGNLAKRRDNRDASGLGLYPGWTFAWPGNIRILYNRASCNGDGRPVDDKRRLVWWDAAQRQWTGFDVPDVVDKAKGPGTPEGLVAFKMTAEAVGRLFAAPYASKPPGAALPAAVSAVCADGPLPEFYEPLESPAANLLHPQVQYNPVLKVPRALAELQKLGGSDAFPYVLTTYASGTEHFCSGSLTRNLPWLVELMPQAFVEIGSALAAKLGIKYGDMVEVRSARGAVHAIAMVTERIQPLIVDGREVHTVGMPFGWGFAGLATGPSVNAVTVDAIDPTAGTPEYKVCLVNIRKVS